MKVQTSKLEGWPLAWAVAIAEGDKVFRPRVTRPIMWHPDDPGADDQWIVSHQVPRVGWFADSPYNPHENWLIGGPIIERERITLRVSTMPGTAWVAFYDEPGHYHAHVRERGPTPLIAAMRCYVASKIGNEVDIPEELL